MRGIYTPVTDIRRKVFTEVARMAYEDNAYADYAQQVRELPYKIIPGEVGQLRSSIFLERAIVSERIRLAMGLSLRPLDESVPATEDLEHSVISDKYYEPPLINVIKFACNRCPEKVVKVTAMCQGCLAHPCQEVCPKKCITFRNGKSHIDQSLCIKCGRCVNTCPYNAIVKVERPCAKACGMDAIKSDEYGRAEINYDKCVSCGMCLVNCPFGAIVDKGQVFQLIQSIKKGDRVIAIVAPAFINQFPGMTPAKLRAAMQQLGFAGVSEVAVGADLCTIDEANDFMKEVPEKIPFMGTSCCPAWSVMAKKLFPEQAECISMTMTPMVLTARLIKHADKDARICFVGPCAAKKLEASRRTVRSEVDFVVTFEELMGLFEAKQIDLAAIPNDPNDTFDDASADGRGFAVAGGVAQAVVNAIHKIDPEREVKVASAQGLTECRKLMTMAKAGKYNGYLLEGMACPGGCIAGAGTLADPARSAAMLAKYKSEAPMKSALDTPYQDSLAHLKY
ncbi:MAG: 4Fe-4S dicluster domain-containing protein [Gemmiger sp.]|nr:4Fe-4S dicluster domain-containing protein [Gemmiger sp.]